MGNRCQSLQLCCVATKILCYQFCCCCLHEKKISKKNIDILMLGLRGVGKTHMLATLLNEPTDSIRPTDGFSMKDVLLETTIFHIKELGGSDKIRPYWSHYMNQAHGMIYLMNCEDGLDDETSFTQNKDIIESVMSNPSVNNIPLLVIVKTNIENGLSVDYIIEKLNLEITCSNTTFLVSFIREDLEGLKHVFERFSDLITGKVSNLD